MTPDLPTPNHSEAMELAQMKQSESNLARCYLDIRCDLAAAVAALYQALDIIQEAGIDGVVIDDLRAVLAKIGGTP